MVESFEQTYFVDDIDSQYGYKLSQDTPPTSQLLRESSPTTTMRPLTYTDNSVGSNLDHRVVPITSSVRNINGGGSVNFLRQMEYINKMQEIIHHPGFLTSLTSGTSSDVSDGTQQQPAQHPRQQHYPTLIPPSTIPAANNARHNSTPSHQQPIIPNHHDFSRHTTTYNPSNNHFGQDPRKSPTAATTTNYNDSRITENQNNADTGLPWLNDSSSSSIHSEYITTAVYPTTSNHQDNSHCYYHSYHHTTPTTGSSNDSLPSTTTTEYLPSPPSFSSNEKHLSQFFIHHDEEYFVGSSNNHNILEMSPPCKRTKPSPRDIASTSLGSDLQHHLLMYHDYSEQAQGPPRFSTEENGRSVEISDDLFPPLQMPYSQQNHTFQQQQQRRPRKDHSRQASSSSTSSWQPQQQRSRNKKHGHQMANSGTKSSNVVRNSTATTTARTPLAEANQSALSPTQQQKRQTPTISSPNNKNYGTLPEHDVDDRPHQCVQCNRGFNRQQDLKRHLNSVHEKQVIHTCSVCHRSFSRRDSLLRHQKKCRSDLSFSTSLNGDNNSVSSDSISNADDYNNSISSNNYHHQRHNHQNTTQQQHHHSLLYN
ncbi:hypothetical protein BDC45DRAFT_520498 [Circinella umbellata]|nr:hypothetical protein BDC45DRAFT_520498 [Circinella umbellata]